MYEGVSDMLENLKHLRKTAGISQRELAEVIGVSQQSINKYENHNTEPDIETLTRLADYFNTSIDYLTGHTDIQRRIEAVHPYDLNLHERRLIDSYRILTEKQRRSIDAVLGSFAEQQKE